MNPERRKDRENEPIPNGPLGDAPPSLTPAAEAVWEEMALHGFWLTDADRLLCEIAASLMADFRIGELSVKAVPALVNTLNKLGFGPAERSKIKGPKAKEEPKEPGFEQFNY